MLIGRSTFSAAFLVMRNSMTLYVSGSGSRLTIASMEIDVSIWSLALAEFAGVGAELE